MKPIVIFLLAFFVIAVAAVYLVVFSSPGVPAAQKTPSQNISNNQSGACTLVYSPVCGTDNKTYLNKCNAESFGVNISYLGECQGQFVPTCSIGQDICANSTHILKFNCVNNSPVNYTFACPSNYTCLNGVCNSQPIIHSSQCVDSDGGLDHLTFGTVTSSGKVYNDSCTIITQVQEYYCQNNSVASTDIMCPLSHHCQNGSCIPKPVSCEDTDGGLETKLKGTVTVINGFTKFTMGTDRCFNGTDVWEYYCLNNSVAEEIVSCGSSYYCVEGKCIYAKCKDSDNGQDLLTIGVITRGHESFTDSCSGTLNVKEYYCDSNEIRYSINTCPSSYVCDSGLCIKP